MPESHPAPPGDHRAGTPGQTPAGSLDPRNTGPITQCRERQARCPGHGVPARIKELRRALTRVDREIANYTRAIGKGDFSSLDQALGAAEQRRASLHAELARLDGNQPAVLQLTPAALERHLQGMTEKLRSGVHGKVREAIQQSVARILVGDDGCLTVGAKPGGLLGMGGTLPEVAVMSRRRSVCVYHQSSSRRRRHWSLIR